MCAQAVTAERPAGSPSWSAAKRSAVVFAAGAVPLAAGRLVPLDGTAVDGPALICPFRAATGLPCPLCGGTRAIALLAHGDGSFLSYGAVWALVALIAAVGGVAGIALAGIRRDRWSAGRVPPRGWVAAGAAVVALAWAYALAHADAITES
jgi:uncharacterized protein DUF2752